MINRQVWYADVFTNIGPNVWRRGVLVDIVSDLDPEGTILLVIEQDNGFITTRMDIYVKLVPNKMVGGPYYVTEDPWPCFISGV